MGGTEKVSREKNESIYMAQYDLFSLLIFFVILLSSILFPISNSLAQSSECCEGCCDECCAVQGSNADAGGDEDNTHYGGTGTLQDEPISDSDGDGIEEAIDNCPYIPNADQADGDGDGIGNVCDNCPYIPNTDQADGDGDGIGNVCDNCPDTYNPLQTDSDNDGFGDACDTHPAITGYNLQWLIVMHFFLIMTGGYLLKRNKIWIRSAGISGRNKRVVKRKDKKTGKKFHFFIVCLTVIIPLLSLGIAYSLTNDGYRGTTISGRTSLRLISAPGGIRVNTFNANLFLNRTDMVIPGRGLPVEIQMTYNSMARDVSSPYGNGWQFNYNIRYLLEPDNDIVIIWGDGRTDLFDESGGSYTPVNKMVYTSLQQYQPGKFRLTTKQKIVYYFDNSGHKKLTKIEEPNGNSITFSYNFNNQLTTITDASGSTLSFSYNINGKLIQITDYTGRNLNYYYDSEGNQTQFKNPLGYSTYYAYDSNSLLTGITDPNGKTVTIAYNSYSRPVIISTAKSEKTITWNTGTLTTTVTNKIDGSTTTSTSYTYDATVGGRMTSKTEAVGKPEQRTTNYTYYSSDNTESVTEAVGKTEQRTTNYTYDSNGNMLTKIEAVGKPEQRTTNYTYDARGNMLTKTEAVGTTEQRITSYAYDSYGQMTKITNPKTIETTYEYDSYGNTTKKTVDPGTGKLNITTTYTYDTVGNRTSVKDPNLNTTTYTYDLENRIIKIKDALLNETNYTYDSNGNRLSRTEAVGKPEQRTTNYTYDSYGPGYRLTKVKEAVGKPEERTTEYTYDSVGNRTSVKDPNLNITTYTYDSLNRMVKVTDPLSNETNYTYDDMDNRKSMRDARGNTTSYEYDSLNRIKKVKDALTKETNYTYDAVDNRTSVTDASSVQTTYTYDSLNRMKTEVKDSGGINATTTYTYDAVDNRLTYTDPNTNTITYTYDAANRIETITNPESETTSYTYDKAGNIKTVTTPNSNVTTYTYDAVNRLKTVSDSTGTVATYTYDAVGNRLTEKDANNNTISYAYDALNRNVSVTDPLNEVITYTYDSNSNLRTVTDRNNNITTFTYDELNRKETVRDDLGNTTTYNYDAVGNLASIEDANGNITNYSYDSLNRLIKETYADTTTREFTYNPVGSRITRKDNNGNTTIYTYDNLYRLTNRDYPDSNDDTFGYDAGGRMSTASNNNAAISYIYDDANRILSETLNGNTTGYSYDASAGKRTITYPGGRVIEENMNLRSFLNNIKEGASTIAGYTYDPASRVTGRSYLNNGTSMSLNYDNNNRVTDLTHNPGGFVDFNYAFDNEGNRLYEEKVHRPARSEQYTYDDIYRLTNYKAGALSGGEITAPVTQTQYNYDGVGNGTSTDRDGTVTTYTPNNMNEYTAIVDGGTINPVYDNNGNLTNDGTNTYTYDYENRLISVSGGVTATYSYDPLGRRIQKVTGGSTTNYYFDGARVIEERNASDSVVATYVYGSGIDEILTMDRGGTIYYYHQNSLGSVVAVTNAAGAVVERYEYDAYGKVTIYDNSYTQLPSSAIGNPYMFTGREYDQETGLYYYRARYYSPTLGRFLQRDPLGYVDGMNLYEYVGGNANNFIDPFGLFKSECPPCFPNPNTQTINDIEKLKQNINKTGKDVGELKNTITQTENKLKIENEKITNEIDQDQEIKDKKDCIKKATARKEILLNKGVKLNNDLDACIEWNKNIITKRENEIKQKHAAKLTELETEVKNLNKKLSPLEENLAALITKKTSLEETLKAAQERVEIEQIEKSLEESILNDTKADLEPVEK